MEGGLARGGEQGTHIHIYLGRYMSMYIGIPYGRVCSRSRRHRLVPHSSRKNHAKDRSSTRIIAESSGVDDPFAPSSGHYLDN